MLGRRLLRRSQCKTDYLLTLLPILSNQHLQEHPTVTLLPAEFAGQETAEYELTEKGLIVDAVIDPEYPALHEHPSATVLPFELAGHETAEQDPV